MAISVTALLVVKRTVVPCRLWLLGLLVCLTACGPKVEPADSVARYLNALKAGDTKTAYALLSEEDKRYFDLERFEHFLTRQPQIQVLFGGSEANKNYGALREQFSYEMGEAKEINQDLKGARQDGIEVLVKLTLPDAVKMMGPSLIQYYLFGEEIQPHALEQTLALSRQVNGKLKVLTQPNAPVLTSYQKFMLVKHEGQWQISVPAWRVEAMLAEAKEKLIRKETEEAGVLLEQASSFVVQVDDLTRATFVREAIAGKHMLRYLPQVAVSSFQLQAATPGCSRPATLTLSNRGDRVVTRVDVAVLFLDKEETILDQQVIAINKEFVTKQLSFAKRVKQTNDLLPINAELNLLVCLKPPLHWAGFADLHVAWLELAERGS